MFFLSSARVAVYIPQNKFPIKGDYFNLKFQYTSLNGLRVQDSKYLVEKQVMQNGALLRFFLIHNFEESDGGFKLFLQQYFKIDNSLQVDKFLKFYNIEAVKRQCLLNLESLDKQISFTANFEPFVTALPVNKIITDEILGKNQQEISRGISDKFRENFVGQNTEFKNRFAIILNSSKITDDKQEFLVKKGIEFSVEFGNQEEIWINLTNTNFSRTSKPITQLSISEPINHRLHHFVNIVTGNQLPWSVTSVSKTKFAENFYETFSTSEAAEKFAHNLKFSQKKFWFEQTNLYQTIQLISEMKQISNNRHEITYFDRIGQIPFKYKIVHRRKKFIFANDTLHYTAAKGLNHSGVLCMPKNLKIKLIISNQVVEVQEIKTIIANINQRITFLYKTSVSLISEIDLIVFDYKNFTEQILRHSIQGQKGYSYIVHLTPFNTAILDNKNEQRQVIEQTNQKIIELLKEHRVRFTTINDLDQYVVANALLKMGLKHKAIPWKIDFIDVKDNQHIFIGIDLGHNHTRKISNLTLTAIDNHGCIIKSYEKKELPLNEVISLMELQNAFTYLFKNIDTKEKQITVHRDGIFKELDNFHAIFQELGIKSYNLVEVIKGEVPLIGFRLIDESNVLYLDGFEGYYVYIDDLSYLITNDQSLNTGTSPTPLKIRKRFGYKSITQLTEEIYWLTKPYSINIFLPSKLPITTLLANNLSYSRDLIHFTT